MEKISNDVIFSILSFIEIDHHNDMKRVNKYMAKCFGDIINVSFKCQNLKMDELMELAQNQPEPFHKLKSLELDIDYDSISTTTRSNAHDLLSMFLDHDDEEWGVFKNSENYNISKFETFIRHSQFIESLVLHLTWAVDYERIAKFLSCCKLLKRVTIIGILDDNLTDLILMFSGTYQLIIIGGSNHDLSLSLTAKMPDFSKRYVLFSKNYSYVSTSNTTNFDAYHDIDQVSIFKAAEHYSGTNLYEHYVTKTLVQNLFKNKKGQIELNNSLCFAIERMGFISFSYGVWSKLLRNEKYQPIVDKIFDVLCETDYRFDKVLFGSEIYHRLFHMKINSLQFKRCTQSLETAFMRGISFAHINYIQSIATIDSVKWMLNHGVPLPKIDNLMNEISRVRDNKRASCILELLIDSYIKENGVDPILDWFIQNNSYFAKFHYRRINMFTDHVSMWKQSIKDNDNKWKLLFGGLINGKIDWLEFFLLLDHDIVSGHIKGICNNKFVHDFINNNQCVHLYLMGFMDIGTFVSVASRENINYLSLKSSEEQTKQFLISISLQELLE